MKDIRAKAVLAWGIVICGMILSAGCAGKRQTVQTKPEVVSAETGLNVKLEQVERENERLKKQVETLSGLPSGKRAEALYKIQTIRIGNYTNIYKEDEEGEKEKLVVYVSPIDETGDDDPELQSRLGLGTRHSG